MELPVINKQTKSGISTNPDYLEVTEVFQTIQGEGPLAGMPAVFIRLAGCNLQCPMCDTSYPRKQTITDVGIFSTQILGANRTINGEKRTLFVITGGEPFRQNFSKLARHLVYAGHQVQVETNGTLWQDDVWPCRFSIVCSPKTPKIHPEIEKRMVALKYVLREGLIDPNDGLPTDVLGSKLAPARPPANFKGEIYVQPEDDQDPAVNNANLKVTIEVAKRFGYRLGLQIHKIIGEP